MMFRMPQMRRRQDSLEILAIHLTMVSSQSAKVLEVLYSFIQLYRHYMLSICFSNMFSYTPRHSK